jgi:hypothetical protein
MTTATTTADAACLAQLETLDGYASEHAVLDLPLVFVWPLAGPFGALLLSAMAWLSVT